MSVQALSCAIALRDVSASEKLLLLVLANYADEHMACWPSHRRLAADTCLSERTILTLMKALEARGLLSRSEQRRKDGSRTSDLITLCIGGETISPRGEAASGGVGKPLQGGGEMVSPLTTFEPSSEPSKEPAGDPPGFAGWWDAYPRKVAKGAARKAYRSALKKKSADGLYSTLVDYPFPPEAKFVPHPATWLNGECWDDNPPAATGPPITDDPWRVRLLNWRLNAYWNSEWGPKPGKPGYEGPEIESQAA